jgi:pyruvate/2-oxoglutarate dehydrogenase complex dihydrolipoamide acyltransferase (E2) component
MTAITGGTSDASKTTARAAWICLAIAWLCFLLPAPGIGIFIGWPLNLVAFILAIVAMAKGGTMKGLWQLLASLIASPIVYFIGLAVLAGTVGAAAEAGKMQQGAPRQEQQAQQAAKNAQEEQQPAAGAESLTRPQKYAAKSATRYLSISGFSRNGLIHQLSSSAGEGYDVADATVAVDGLKIDWNQQAVRSAKQYLDVQAFSCKGLIRQLSSRAGEKYTVDQATYGAQQAGACN